MDNSRNLSPHLVSWRFIKKKKAGIRHIWKNRPSNAIPASSRNPLLMMMQKMSNRHLHQKENWSSL